MTRRGWFWLISLAVQMFVLGDIWDGVGVVVRIMGLVAALCTAFIFYCEVSRHEDDTL